MEYISIIIIFIILFIIIYSGKKKSNKEKYCISFMETFNLTDIPIITMFSGTNKINFLLDTGASQSFISQKASKYINGIETTCDLSLISANGSEESHCKVVETILSFKHRNFKVKLTVNKNLDTAFFDLKEKKGITLHGILGSDFFNKYSYIIDFKKYVAYPQ